MEKKWVDKEVQEDIPEDLRSYNSIIAKLLLQRGLNTKELVDRFFFPKIEHLHDPFLMKDMDKAVDRLDRAVQNKENILVYGDYDVDGTTAVAVVYSFLKSLDAFKEDNRLFFFIPDRYVDGYGLSKRGVDYAKERNVSLMIVLDCGIKDHQAISYAKEQGIDIVVGDHHRPGATLPEAVAVLDPKREDCEYPYKELSGCGVGFKLISAYALKFGLDLRKYVYPLLDLVAISIASDIVPLTEENRVLSYYGLMLINTQPRSGIEAILSFSNIQRSFDKTTLARGCNRPLYFNKEITNSDLVFQIGPRINAAGRIDSGRVAVNLLIAKKLEEAVKVGDSINESNIERKKLDKQATEEALVQIKALPDAKTRVTTVVYSPNWNQGIVGIVASRLTETYYRPTIVFTKSQTNGMLVGSARSIRGFDIYDAIEACGEYLQHFGGHKYAAGLSILPEDYEAFSEKFNQVVEETLDRELLVPWIEIDMALKFEDITPALYKDLMNFAPFGPKNTNPIFKSVNVQDTHNSRIVGTKQHLKLELFQPDSSSYPLSGIAFKMGDAIDLVKDKKNINICYHIEENHWKGNVNLQLNVRDIKSAE